METGDTLDIWYSFDKSKLSNLAEKRFLATDGHEFISVEHAYQSYKSGSLDVSIYMAHWEDGSKYVGAYKAKTKNNWNISLMERIMFMSFYQNPDAIVELLATGDRILTHNNDRGIWRKEFPRILMSLRNRFKVEI